MGRTQLNLVDDVNSRRGDALLESVPDPSSDLSLIIVFARLIYNNSQLKISIASIAPLLNYSGPVRLHIKRGKLTESEALLEQMKQHLSTDAGKAIVKKIALVYQINIAPMKIGFNEVVYTIDLKNGEVKKGEYEGGKADATFSFKDEDFVKIALGKMNPQIAFMRGAMKIKGSLSAAQKFTPDIFPKPSKM